MKRNGLKQTDIFKLYFRGVKIGLSQGVNFRLSFLLGDYCKHTDFSTFLSNSNKSIRNDLARLKGARLVCSIEAERDSHFSEVILKRVTGGEPITARYLYQEYFEYHPEFKIFLSANHKPKIQGGDHAIWRRIRLIPFKKVIVTDEQDKNLNKKLKKELSGILNWALKGAYDWKENGLIIPDAVKTATHEYKDEMDAISRYLDDCTIFDPKAKVSKKRFYNNYLNWCQNRAIPPFGKIKFNEEITNRGFLNKDARVDGKKGRYWFGIGLKP